MYSRQGFTLIELLAAMFIISLISVFAVSSFIEYRDQQLMRTAKVEVQSLLKETRQKTISGESTGQFGLHFDSDKMVLFIGNIYDPASSSNQVFAINQAFLDTNFSDGSDEIVFERLTGVPSATGTIAIFDKSYDSTIAFTISESGLVE